MRSRIKDKSKNKGADMVREHSVLPQRTMIKVALETINGELAAMYESAGMYIKKL